MASQTQLTRVWASSRRWTGKPGMLQSMGWPRVGHDWATEQQHTSGINRNIKLNIKIREIHLMPAFWANAKDLTAGLNSFKSESIWYSLESPPLLFSGGPGEGVQSKLSFRRGSICALIQSRTGLKRPSSSSCSSLSQSGQSPWWVF